MKLSKIAVGVGATVALLFGTAVFAQTPPVLNVSAAFASNLNVGAQNATVATITLSNPSPTTPVDVRSIPLVLINSGLVSNCRVQNAGTGATLTTGANVLLAPNTSNFIALDAPLAVAASGNVVLNVVCNVASNATAGSVVGIALLPGNVFATAAGATTTSLGVGIPAGSAFADEFTIGGTGTPTPPPTTPDLPNTGAGGEAMLFYSLLALGALIAGAGALKLARA